MELSKVHAYIQIYIILVYGQFGMIVSQNVELASVSIDSLNYLLGLQEIVNL